MKVITVPKDKEAEKLLDYDNANSDQLLELELSAEDFKYLYDAGYWNLINNVTGAIIDEYEDASITDRIQLNEILQILQTKDFDSNSKLSLLNKKICFYLKEAHSRNTGVYFFF